MENIGVMVLVGVLALLVGALASYAFFATKAKSADARLAEKQRMEDELKNAKNQLEQELNATKSQVEQLRNEKFRAESDLSAATARIQAKEEEISRHVTAGIKLNDDLEALRKALDEERQARAELQGQADIVAAKIAEKEREFEARLQEKQEFEKQLKDWFDATSSKSLEEARKQFAEFAKKEFVIERDQSKAEIDKIVAPMRETLEKLEKGTKELEIKRETTFEVLKTQIDLMTKEAQTLSKALTRPEVRGSWGELTLLNAAEAAGLVNGVDFEMQKSTTTEEGNKLRPDMLIRVGQSLIVVDSKAPLDAFYAVAHAENEHERKIALDRYSIQFKKHISDLSSKAYWNQFSTAPDFVVMFVPSESFYFAALQSDPGLIADLMEKRVVLANPMTFVALCRTVATMLETIKVQKSADEIRKTGQELYEAVRKFASTYQKVGSNLQTATTAYNESIGSLERNLLPKARRMKELGASSTNELPDIKEISDHVRTPKSELLGLEESFADDLDR